MTAEGWAWFWGIVFAGMILLQHCTPEVHAGTGCDERAARALEEIARQERRQADALERSR